MGIKEMLLKKLDQQNSKAAEILSAKDIIEEREIKTCKVEIRVTEEEKEMLRAMAKLRRTSISELIRQVMFNVYLEELIRKV